MHLRSILERNLSKCSLSYWQFNGEYLHVRRLALSLLVAKEFTVERPYFTFERILTHWRNTLHLLNIDINIYIVCVCVRCTYIPTVNKYSWGIPNDCDLQLVTRTFIEFESGWFTLSGVKCQAASVRFRMPGFEFQVSNTSETWTQHDIYYFERIRFEIRLREFLTNEKKNKKKHLNWIIRNNQRKMPQSHYGFEMLTIYFYLISSQF